MELFRSILLGVIQGATEFLPISSSGHLVIIPAFLKIESPNLSLAMFLHFGTLIAVLIYFRKDVANLIKSFFSIFKKERSLIEKKYLKLLILIIIAIIPAVVFGVLFSDRIDQSFSKPKLVSILFIINGFLLLSAHFYSKKGETSLENAKIKNAIFVGFFQVFSLLPGISRSGSTISGGIFSKLKKEDAAKFSFLLSIPTIFGAFIFELRNIFKFETQNISILHAVIGTIVSFLCGVFAIRFFLNLVKKGKLYYFSIYCLILGLIGIFTFR